MLDFLKPERDFFKEGSVIIAGCGPGDPKQITLNVRFAIELADIIIYDGLVNKQILKNISNETKLIFAGKRFGNKSCTQSDIIKWMVKFAQNNKKVLRLKSGDPSIFGRGSEEILELKSNNIPIKVLSGITASQDVINVLNTEYLENSTFFSLITGHKILRSELTKIDFKKYGKQKGKLIVYMGLNQLNSISYQLIEGGKDKRCKVTLVSNVSLNNEKIVKTNLHKCTLTKNNFGLKPPTIIIVDG